MRCSGKTTRLVDHAIQMLFIHKYIVIPSGDRLREYFICNGLRAVKKESIMIDDDVDMNIDGGRNSTIQRSLIDRIKNRLRFEHPSLEIKILNNSIRIS